MQGQQYKWPHLVTTGSLAVSKQMLHSKMDVPSPLDAEPVDLAVLDSSSCTLAIDGFPLPKDDDDGYVEVAVAAACGLNFLRSTFSLGKIVFLTSSAVPLLS